jgi:hypothetical protein
MRPFSRNNPATPGVPMVYQPAKLDHLYSDEVAARLCREYTKECVDRLVDHMRDRRQAAISLAATNSILDRAWGKPKDIKSLQGPDGKEPRIKVQVEFVDTIDMPVREAQTIDQPPMPVFEE